MVWILEQSRFECDNNVEMGLQDMCSWSVVIRQSGDVRPVRAGNVFVVERIVFLRFVSRRLLGQLIGRFGVHTLRGRLLFKCNRSDEHKYMYDLHCGKLFSNGGFVEVHAVPSWQLLGFGWKDSLRVVPDWGIFSLCRHE